MMVPRSQVKELLSKQLDFIKMTAAFLPITVSKLSTAFVTILFAGNLSQAHLDGVGLANTLLNVVVLSLSIGYTSVFHTYGAQVYGSSEPGELVTILVKCLLQGVLVHVVVLGPYLNLVYLIDMSPDSDFYQSTFQKEGNLEDFRDIAVKYLRITFLVEFLDYSVILISKYFAVKGQIGKVYIVSLVLAAAHIMANFIFVSKLNLEVEGLGISVIVGRICALFVSAGLCIVDVKNLSSPWTGFSVKTLMGWKPMLKLGLSGALDIFAKVAVLEVSTFLSQFINTSSLTVIIILIQLMSVGWMICRAISYSTATLMGKALAEGSVLDVQQYMMLALVNTLLEAAPLALISYVFRENLVKIFQDNSDVVDLFTTTFWLVCLDLIINHSQITMNQGMLVTFGKQRFVALSTSFSNFLLGLPFIMITIFLTDLGVTGIFVGWTMSDALILIAAMIRILTTDINKEIEKSRCRVAESVDNCTSDPNDTKSFVTNREDEYLLGEVSKRGGPKGDEPCSIKSEKEEVGSAKVPETSREAKTVLLAYLFFTTLCACLGGVSILRDYAK